MSNFVKNLTKLMDSEKISLSNLHKSTGISKTQLGKYVAGYYEPSVSNLVKLCDFFNCSVNFMLGLTTDENIK